MKEKYSNFFEQLNQSNCFVALTKRNIVKFCIYKDENGNYFNSPKAFTNELVNISRFSKDFRKILNLKPELKVIDRDDAHQLMCLAVDKKLVKYKSDKNHVIHADMDLYEKVYSGEYVSVHFDNIPNQDFNGFVVALVLTDETEYEPFLAIMDENKFIRYIGMNCSYVDITVIDKESAPEKLLSVIVDNEFEIYTNFDKDILKNHCSLIMF